MATGLLVLLGVASYMVGISSMSYQPAEIESLEERGVSVTPPVSMPLQGGSKYVVEATFVFDKQALKKYAGSNVEASAKKDLDIMLGNINFMFDSLKLDMQIGLFSVVYLDKDIITSTKSEQVSKDFRAYVKKNPTGADIAILLTGHAMDNDGITKGVAYIGTACWNEGWNSGVVSLIGTYTPILAAGHEIGHILGCEHDTESGYIMEDRAGNDHWWSFSSKSRDYISKYIAAMDKRVAGKPANCLTSKRQQTVIPGIIEHCQNTRGHECGGSAAWYKFWNKCGVCRKGCHYCTDDDNKNLSG